MSDKEHDCEYCDEIGGIKTLRNQVCMPIKRRVEYIDHCIAKIVAALNAANIVTMASCCGHRKMHGRIDLRDGRVLAIFENKESYVSWQSIAKQADAIADAAEQSAELSDR